MHVSTHALQYVYHIFYILLHNINNGFIQGGEVFPPSHRFQTKFTKISANFPLLCEYFISTKK